jgi:hypothetical protein
MGSLKIMKIRFMDSNGFLQLLDVLGATLSKGCLSLTISLFAFFGGGINLDIHQ